jgi:nitroreductase
MTTADQDPAGGRAAAYGQFIELVRRRRSCRCYDAARAVPRALLDQCLEAARLAPSACNRQPWRFVVADDPVVVAALRAEGKRAGIPHPWWANVPVFVALCVRPDLVTHTVAPLISGIPYYLIDVGIAGEHFVLAAESLGLGTCWIGWYNDRAVRRVLHLPRSLRLVCLITVGWPAPAWERRPAARADLQEIRRWDRWA